MYRTPADIDGFARAADGERCAWIEIDLARVRSKQDAAARVRRSAGFSVAFRRQLGRARRQPGGLVGCLAQGYVIHLRGADAAQHALGATWATLLDILREAATLLERRGKPFIVLVDGARGLPPWT